MMIDQIVILLILLMLSGFFSSAETALFSISKSKARYIAKQKDGASVLIKKMKGDHHRLLSTILIGNNVVNVGASALATSMTIDLFPNYAVGLTTGVMTFLILVFGEVFPKSVATRNNILIARLTIYPIYWLSILFFPIIIFMNFIPRITGRIQKTPPATEEELMTFVEVVEEEGGIEEEEKEFISNIFEFDDTNASEVMTPRADMFIINVDDPLDLERVIKSGFTRIPVIDGELDNIIGLINIKYLFLQQIKSGDTLDVRQIMTPPYFVPENKKLDKLFEQFKKRRQHMAVIVDEHGGVSGLITLEDVLEELVGEISDETDKFEPLIVRTGNNEWRVLGKTEIDDVNDRVPINIPDVRDYDTFSGYVLHNIGRIPDEKENFTLNDFSITVAQKDGNRILEYLVKKNRSS
jgi:putative hemolysin